MVVLTRKADYALLAMACLGREFERGAVSSARAIADRNRIPLSVLMNILKKLQREGLIESVRGARGGYRLARPPQRISLADIVSPIEGPLRVTCCTELTNGVDPPGAPEENACERSSWCPVRGPVQVVQEKLDQFFGEVTLADVVNRTCPAGVPASAEA